MPAARQSLSTVRPHREMVQRTASVESGIFTSPIHSMEDCIGLLPTLHRRIQCSAVASGVTAAQTFVAIFSTSLTCQSTSKDECKSAMLTGAATERVLKQQLQPRGMRTRP